MQKLKILVTAAGGDLSRSMVYYLNKFNFDIIVTDADPTFLAAPQSKKRYLLPRATSRGYFKKLNKIIKKEKIDLAIFQSDIEIRKAAANIKKIKTKVWLPDYKIIKKMQDKYYCNQAWQKQGLTVAKTIVVFQEKQLNANVWLRPLRYIGGGGAMSYWAKTKKEAKAWLDKYQGWGNFTMSEYLPGKIYGFDSLWQKGELWGYFLKERLASTQVNSGKVVKYSTSAVKTSNNKGAIKTAIMAIKMIVRQPDGVFAVDMRENRKGIPCPTEINPGRFLTTSLLLFRELNYDLPLDYINLILGKEIKKRTPHVKDKYLFFIKGLIRVVDKKDMKIEKP